MCGKRDANFINDVQVDLFGVDFELDNFLPMPIGLAEFGDNGLPGSRIRGSTSDGILGYDVFMRFVVMLDFNRALVHIQVSQ